MMKLEIVLGLTQKLIKKNNIILSDIDILEEVDGLYCPRNHKIFINVGSYMFQDIMIYESEDDFIDEFTIVVTHEIIHSLLRTSKDFEEEICMIMAGQLSGFSKTQDLNISTNIL